MAEPMETDNIQMYDPATRNDMLTAFKLGYEEARISGNKFYWKIGKERKK